MQTKEILEKYLEFFTERGHKQISNVSIVPEGDSTLLFLNSGMFPLAPYLSGEPHPLGKRLVNVQKSIRFEDIDEIGDPIHTVAFHMLGNWSLGDYFKKEQLNWIYEFFVEHLGLDINRLYSSVYEGDKVAPRDDESIVILKEIFKKYGIKAEMGERIFEYDREENWWQRGDTVGELGGPDSEIFYYMGKDDPKGKSPAEHPDKFLEFGNSVFMQYKKIEDGWEELPNKNVDFGGGLERIALIVQGKEDIFETDNFWPIIEVIQDLTKKDYYESEEVKKHMRILADHMRSAVFLAMDGVFPSNKDQGYVLRRLIRKMVRSAKVLGVEKDLSVNLVSVVVQNFVWLYPELEEKRKEIEEIFANEELKFQKTLQAGERKVEKIIASSRDENIESLVQHAFGIYQSMGYPSEIFFEDLTDAGILIDKKNFEALFADKYNEHQDISRKGADQKFKGGLADQSDQVVKFHTATHILQMALKKVLGDEVTQLGSNITGDRLRFDFPFKRKLENEELVKIEKIMNETIEASYPVNFEIMDKGTAISLGAIYLKGETYPEKVKVYYIGDSIENAVSKEFCGGPHVVDTGTIGPLEIFKQESIGEGKMRLYIRAKM
jgi:alanyl-tRNA synthetase